MKSSAMTYTDPSHIAMGQSLRAVTLREGKPFGYMTVLDDLPNLATGKVVKYNIQWEESYPASGEKALTDAQLAAIILAAARILSSRSGKVHQLDGGYLPECPEDDHCFEISFT